MKPTGGICFEWKTRRSMSGSDTPTHCSVNSWKLPLQHVGEKRRELVAADVEIDADLQILLNDRRLQADELVGRHLQRQPQPRLRTIAVRIAIAGLVEQRARLRRDRA